MKYIRTKDGRIIDLERYENKTTSVLKARGFITLIDKLKMCDIEVYEKDIIKQADTVEELCDLFAFEDAFDVKHLTPDFFSSMALARLWAKKMNKSLIGYIIVEKNGAKAIEPVAKTNDIGKFELLYE